MHNVFVIVESRRLNSDKVRVGAGVRTIDDKGFFSLLTIVWVELEYKPYFENGYDV